MVTIYGIIIIIIIVVVITLGQIIKQTQILHRYCFAFYMTVVSVEAQCELTHKVE